MKRLFGVLILLAVASSNRLMAQTVSFNFSAGAQPVSGWINVAGNPAAAVITATDPTSGIKISSVAAANWSPFGTSSCYDGGGASGPNPFFPNAVLANHWFNYSNYYAAYNALMPQFAITGLNIDSVYTLKMTGSFQYDIPSHFSLNPIRYTVAGATLYGYIDIDGDSNYATGAVFYNVAPDSSGSVHVYVNTYNGSNLASICGLQIMSGQPTGPRPSISLTSPTNNAIFPEDGNVTLRATASETNGTIARVEFYADSTLIGSDSTAPYSTTWLNPDPGSYTINVRAIDGTGNVGTSSINITVESLNYFWSTTGNIATGGDTSFVGTVDSNRLAFRTKNIERMSILPTGNIGIGTKTPQAALDVVDTSTGMLLPRLTTAQRNSIASGDLRNGLLLYNTDSSAFQYYNGSSWNSVGSGSSGSSGRWLFANGTVYDTLDNIAIGTSNPQGYKLAVNGSGIFTKIVAKPYNNWPDYVFDKGYRLPSLMEVEQYIQAHHHLPDVTPEAEIMQNGIDLGEGQTTLLKKVEELTLYLINENQSLTMQNRQMTEQSKAVAEQARQLAEQTKQLADQTKQLAGQNKQLNEQNARLEAQQKEIDELKALIRADHKQ